MVWDGRVLDEGDVPSALDQTPEGSRVRVEGLAGPPDAVGVRATPAEAAERFHIVAVGVILAGFSPGRAGAPREELGDGVDVVAVAGIDEPLLQKHGHGHLPAWGGDKGSIRNRSCDLCLSMSLRLKGQETEIVLC